VYNTIWMHTSCSSPVLPVIVRRPLTGRKGRSCKGRIVKGSNQIKLVQLFHHSRKSILFFSHHVVHSLFDFRTSMLRPTAMYTASETSPHPVSEYSRLSSYLKEPAEERSPPLSPRRQIVHPLAMPPDRNPAHERNM